MRSVHQAGVNDSKGMLEIESIDGVAVNAFRVTARINNK